MDEILTSNRIEINLAELSYIALVCALQTFDFWQFKTVESKNGHSNVCYRSVFSRKCGTVYYAVHDGSKFSTTLNHTML